MYVHTYRSWWSLLHMNERNSGRQCTLTPPHRKWSPLSFICWDDKLWKLWTVYTCCEPVLYNSPCSSVRVYRRWLNSVALELHCCLAQRGIYVIWTGRNRSFSFIYYLAGNFFCGLLLSFSPLFCRILYTKLRAGLWDPSTLVTC